MVSLELCCAVVCAEVMRRVVGWEIFRGGGVGFCESGKVGRLRLEGGWEGGGVWFLYYY